MFRIAPTVCLLVLGIFIADTGAQSLNANDGSKEPPRLMLVQAMWGMGQLPSNEAEWSLEEKLRLVKEAGFDGVDFAISMVAGKEQQIKERLAKYDLKLGLQTFPNTLEDLKKVLPVVKQMRSPYLDVHVGNYYVPEKAAIDLLRSLAQASKQSGVAMMVQTHRGRVTQDLLRTVNYTRAIPDLRLFLDLSHYFVAGEIGGKLSLQSDELFDALLDGRVSNGQQVQIDLGPAGDNTHAQNFAALWKRAMVYWLKSAQPGDLFVFRVELGPPNYSILDPNGKEISNRWEQAKVMGTLAERIWNEAVEETGTGARHVSKISAK